ncbi:hypothetical protein PRZ48_014743 [Zasmidium cellare]|uniref:Uncharacterized protein n=1 Tax=Zasmidium cellare TaxID=395010 RepID=A0ABR0DZ39_ZASCE|nr:hypothetical protein PRZ48_014743 [Zasmidium cellare]
MHYKRTLVTLLASSPLAWTSAIGKATPLEERKALAGCSNGRYVISYTENGQTCLTHLGFTLALTPIVLSAAALAATVKSAFFSSTPAQASCPTNTSASTAGLDKRAAPTPVAYNFDFVPGVDYHNATNSESESDWDQFIDDSIKYMGQQQVDCIQAIVGVDATNYQNQMTIWVDMGDGAIKENAKA